MNITVVGTGYVGLVTGLCFAEIGNNVICIDIDKKKIAGLNEGKSPIYEENIDTLLSRNLRERRITFSTDLGTAINNSEVLFIAVGTPPQEDGSADLKYVSAVAQEIGQKMQSPKTIVIKSTVPVGTNKFIREKIQKELDTRGVNFEFHMVSNPEFLREGCAIADCLNPDRIIIGYDSPEALENMNELYAPFVREGSKLIAMDIPSAEFTKYASNVFLATKISLMNEFSRLSEKVGANIENIRIGIGADHRIGPHFIYAGVGYGGSCFPKDVKALIHAGEENSESMKILKAVDETNEIQRRRFVDKVLETLPTKKAKIAVWGVAFKPGTDDVREAPAIYAIERFLEKGHEVVAYDPLVQSHNSYSNTNSLFKYESDIYESLAGADALCVFVEMKNFREPNFNKIKSAMKAPVIFDGRNLYDPKKMHDLGFKYHSIGRN